MNLEDQLKALADVGLNIFASCRVERLPAEILEAFTNHEIRFHKDQTLCLIGNGGNTLWENVPRPWSESDHPIDSFSVRLVEQLNQSVLHDPGLQVLYPSPKYQIPLQKIGRFLNVGRPSVLGLDINSKFGVWFAYRAAFLTNADIPESRWPDFESPCGECTDQPCRPVCPSDAVGASGDNASGDKFNLSACTAYRFSEHSRCRDRCLSRINCSYQPGRQYSLEQHQYHMGRADDLARAR